MSTRGTLLWATRNHEMNAHEVQRANTQHLAKTKHEIPTLSASRRRLIVPKGKDRAREQNLTSIASQLRTICRRMPSMRVPNTVMPLSEQLKGAPARRAIRARYGVSHRSPRQELNESRRPKQHQSRPRH